jgi:serine protease Do
VGYYNQGYEREKKKNRWITPLLLGVIIGILIVTFVIPELMRANIIPYSIDEQNTEQSAITVNDENSTVNTPVSVDVTTQITEIVEQVTPAVVGVTNIQSQSGYWFEQGAVEAGTGSGVVYKITDGTAYIVTNYHVIEEADSVEVVLYDETHIEGEVIGGDIFSDLAVIQADAAAIEESIEIGQSGSIKVGEPAIAIGNPLGHMFSSTVTQGVISATERTIPMDLNFDGRPDWQAEVIQTDAAINPGNSGGALINIYGQLIGINSMKINESAVEGIGFAIPVDYALPIMEELEAKGVVERPFLGVEIYSLDEIPQQEWEETLVLPSDITAGVYVWSVERFSPADQGGLERLDVITELNGQIIENVIDLRQVLYQDMNIGDTLGVVFYRDGERMETEVTLEAQ